MMTGEHSTRERLFLACALGAGSIVLLSGIHRGWSSDEIVLIERGSVGTIFWNVEGSVNPPLHRIIVDILLGGSPERGRWFSWICAVGSLAFAFVVGKRVGRSASTGFIALAIVALNPLLLDQATMVRCYSLWMLVGFWHVHSTLRLCDEGKLSIEGTAAIVASSALLPWIHYLSVPLLFIEAVAFAVFRRNRARQAIALILVPAALSALPLLPLILSDSPIRRPGDWTQMGSTAIDALSAGWSVTGLLTAPWLIWRLRVERPLTCEHRMLLAGLAGAVVTMVSVRPWVMVRGDTTLLATPFLAPLLVSLHRGALPTATRLLLAVLCITGAICVVFPLADRRDGVQHFREQRAKWERVSAGRPVYITPSYQLPAADYELTMKLLADSPPPKRCPPHATCFEDYGVLFVGVDGGFRTLHGLVVSFDDSPAQELVEGCKALQHGTYLHIFKCPSGATTRSRI